VEASPNPPVAGKSRAVFYGLVVAVLAAVIVVAWYQEQIGYFFRLRTWDQEAPGRTVSSFLTAGYNGNQQEADAHLGTDAYRPIQKDGKWGGYSMVSQAGTLIFDFKELTAGPDPKPSSTEFQYVGPGAAVVTVPDSKGKPVKYRLQMQEGGWKITEILGGRPAS
jgi:hypothetical protein